MNATPYYITNSTAKPRCLNCGSQNLERVRKITTSGKSQVYDLCLDCGRNAVKPGFCISHKLVGDLSQYRIIEDYSAAAEPCARCGSETGTEWHHFGMKHIFEDAESWPGAYLCPNCHREWHNRIAQHFQTCELCRNLYGVKVDERELPY
jgi:hypothetical protein